jgi:hypothetical protein
MVVKPRSMQAMTQQIYQSGIQPGIRSQLMLRSISIVLSTLVGTVLVSPIPAIAQSTNSDALQRTGSSDQDPNAFGDTGLDMFDLIHRAQQGAIRNPYEFSQEQQNNINSEADNFRTRQREALEQQPGNTPPATAPVTPPQSE